MDGIRRLGGLRSILTVVALASAMSVGYASASALATHMSGWTHDHSIDAIPPGQRPRRAQPAVRRSMHRPVQRRPFVLAAPVRGRRRVRVLQHLHRPERRLQHPQPHRRRAPGRRPVPGHRRLQLPAHLRLDLVVGAFVGRRDRHELAAEPAGAGSLERAGVRRRRPRHVPPRRLARRVPGPSLLLGSELRHHPRTPCISSTSPTTEPRRRTSKPLIEGGFA